MSQKMSQKKPQAIDLVADFPITPMERELHFEQGFSDQFDEIFYDGMKVCSADFLEHYFRELIWLLMEIDVGLCIRR